MKKTLICMLALLCAGIAFGQNAKEKVAIYTEDKSGRNYAEFAGEFLTNSIVKRDIYAAYERTADFLNMLSKEQGYQRSGTVLDSDIAKLGAQLGVDLVCAVKIGLIDNQPFISARLIDVETGNLQATAKPHMFQFGNLTGFETSCENVTKSMFGERESKETASIVSTVSATTVSTALVVSTASENTDEYIKMEEYGFMVTKKDLGPAMTFRSANELCAALELGGFSNWRLPTKAELAILYKERATIGNFETRSNPWYWSSTSDKGKDHWVQNFSNGVQNDGDNEDTYRYRCVRK
ncbi:MAG: DUF1566 domain-containing protein [Bacteroidales bacterium]|nr:DUF1566 domain-containing protein [Bacteroidales bacterium]